MNWKAVSLTQRGTNPSDDGTDPVLARWMLDDTIRQLHEADGRSPRALAEATYIGVSTVKRWLNGENQEWKSTQLLTLLAAYGYAHDHAVSQQLLQLAADARHHNVVQRPEWLRSTAFDLFVALEQVSEEILTYEFSLVPGLAQTEDYARGMYAQRVTDPDELEERVRLRIGRQAVLRRTDKPPVRLRVVIDEGVLHRGPTGDPAVMRGQLKHLLDVGRLPNVTVRVIPFAAGPYGSDGNGPFVIMDSARVGRRITYVETSVSATYHETPSVTERYDVLWRRLAGLALGAEESAAMIGAALSRL